MTDANGSLRVAFTGGVLVVCGELDAHTSGLLAVHLDPLPAGAGEVVVDLSGVEFIDSSGLRLLVATHQQATEAGRRLVLRDPSKVVERLLDIAGLADHLHVSGGSGD